MDYLIISQILAALAAAILTWRFRPQEDSSSRISFTILLAGVAAAVWGGCIAWQEREATTAFERGEAQKRDRDWELLKASLRNYGEVGQQCLRLQQREEQKQCANDLFQELSGEAATTMDAWLHLGQGAVADDSERGTSLVNGVQTGPRHAHLGFRSLRCMVRFSAQGNPEFVDRCVFDTMANFRLGPRSSGFSSPFKCEERPAQNAVHCQTREAFTYWDGVHRGSGRLFLSYVQPE